MTSISLAIEITGLVQSNPLIKITKHMVIYGE